MTHTRLLALKNSPRYLELKDTEGNIRGIIPVHCLMFAVRLGLRLCLQKQLLRLLIESQRTRKCHFDIAAQRGPIIKRSARSPHGAIFLEKAQRELNLDNAKRQDVGFRLELTRMPAN